MRNLTVQEKKDIHSDALNNISFGAHSFADVLKWTLRDNPELPAIRVKGFISRLEHGMSQADMKAVYSH